MDPNPISLFVAIVLVSIILTADIIFLVMCKKWLDSAIDILGKVYKQTRPDHYDLLGSKSVREEMQREYPKFFFSVFFCLLAIFDLSVFAFLRPGPLSLIGVISALALLVIAYITGPHPWRFSVPSEQMKKILKEWREDDARERAESDWDKIHPHGFIGLQPSPQSLGEEVKVADVVISGGLTPENTGSVNNAAKQVAEGVVFGSIRSVTVNPDKEK